MTNTTTSVNNNTSSTNAILDALNKLKDRTDKQEIVLSEFLQRGCCDLP